MRNEKMKKAAALALAGTMMLSTVSPAAFATDEVEDVSNNTDSDTENQLTQPDTTVDNAHSATPVNDSLPEVKDDYDVKPVVVDPVIPTEEGDTVIQVSDDTPLVIDVDSGNGDLIVTDESGNQVDNDGVLGVYEKQEDAAGQTEDGEGESQQDPDIIIGDYSAEGPVIALSDGDTVVDPGTITSETEVTFGEDGNATEADEAEKNELEDALNDDEVIDALEETAGSGYVTITIGDKDYTATISRAEGAYSINEEETETGSIITETQWYYLESSSTESAPLTNEEIVEILNAGLDLEEGVTLYVNDAGEIVDTNGNTYTVTKNLGEDGEENLTTNNTWTIAVTTVTTKVSDSTEVEDSLTKEEITTDGITEVDTNKGDLEDAVVTETELQDIALAASQESFTDGSTVTIDGVEYVVAVSEDGVITLTSGDTTFTVSADSTQTVVTVVEGTAGENELTYEDIYELLGGETSGYSYDAETGKLCDTDGHELTFDAESGTLYRVDLSVSATKVVKGEESTSHTVDDTEYSSTEEAQNAAAEQAEKEALEAALQGQGLENATVTKAEDGSWVLQVGENTYTLTESDGTWSVTIPGEEESKTYSFTVNVAQGDAVLGTTEDIVLTDNTVIKGTTSTVTSTATVESGTVTTTKDGSYETEGVPAFIQNGSVTDVVDGKFNGEVVQGEPEYDDQGRIVKVVTTGANGETKTYTFEYSSELTDAEDAAVDEAMEGQLGEGEWSQTGETVTKITWSCTTSSTTTQELNEDAVFTAVGEDGSVVRNTDGSYSYVYTDDSGEQHTVALTWDEEKGCYVDTAGNVTYTFEFSSYSLTDEEELAALSASIQERQDVAAWLAENTDYSQEWVTDENGNITGIRFTSADGTQSMEVACEAQMVSITRVDTDTVTSTNVEELVQLINEMLADGYVITGYETITSVDEEWVVEHCVVNYSAMTDEELIAYLESLKEAAQASGDYYDASNPKGSTGTGGNQGGRPGQGNNGRPGQNNWELDHFDLDSGSTLTKVETDEDGNALLDDEGNLVTTEYDCVILSTGLVVQYSNSAADLISGSGTTIKIQDSITKDTSSGEYEYQHENNSSHPTESAYYSVTGSVAYGLVTFDSENNGGTNVTGSTLTAAEYNALKELIEANGWTVVAMQTSQSGNAQTVYQVYEYTATLMAYGYMNAKSDTCTSNTGYDLLLNNLVLVNNVVSAGNTSVTSYTVTLAKTDEISGSQLTVSSLTTSSTTGGQSNDYLMVERTYEKTEDLGVEDENGNAMYLSAVDAVDTTTWKETTTTGSASGSWYEGEFGYEYVDSVEKSASVLSKAVEAVRTVYAELTKTAAPGGGNGGGDGDNETEDLLPPVEEDEDGGTILILTDEPTEEDIADEPTALAAEPETVIEDEDPPLAADPADEAEILDEETPLSAVPKTGDESGIWVLLSAASGLALAVLSFIDRKGRHARFGSQH